MKSLLFCCLLVLGILSAIALSPATGAMTMDQAEEIDAMVQEQMRKAKIPSASIAVVQGDGVRFLAFGDESVDENALYQIGSTTKAFTALGVLYLEDEGLLSLDDPVRKYLPWFTPQHNGQDVLREDITIANLIYQTSGFTNDETKYPRAQPEMTREEHIRALAQRDLQFYPSVQFAYANANYNTLGLLIEVISGQSYEYFMTATILRPLGLRNTYVNPDLAAQTGAVARGQRLSFFGTWPYDVPISPASLPSGYIISNARDMSRWLQIQLGLVEISPQMTRIIDKSHQADEEHRASSTARYGCGWFVRDDGIIYHSGGTPNYSAKVSMAPADRLAVCVLTNINASANTNAMADNILNILQGKAPLPYQGDIWVTIDGIFTVMTAVCLILALFAVIALCRMKGQIRAGQRQKAKADKKAMVRMAIPALFALLSVAMIVVFPMAFGSSWLEMSIWAPYSLYTGILAFALMSGLLLAATYVSCVRPKHKNE